MVLAAVGHFNRINMSVAGTEHIMKDYSISKPQMGRVYSAFLLIYMLCMTPGGWLIDRVGTRRALMVMGFGLALFATLTGLLGLANLAAVSTTAFLAVLMLIRAMAGAASAPLHPGAARVASHWMPFPSRAVANGLITCAAGLGVASTYYVFGFLMDQMGWPKAFLLTGAVTAALAGLWTVYAKDYPAEHRSVNDRELQLIEDGDPFLAGDVAASRPDAGKGTAATRKPRTTAPLKDTGVLLRNPSLVWLTISYGALGYFQFMIFYWIQDYFEDTLKLGTEASRIYSTLLSFTMALGMVSGGWLTDRFQAVFGVRLGRAIVPVAGLLCSGTFLALGVRCESLFWAVTCMALATAGGGAPEGPFWVMAIDLGGRRGGTAAAILNTGGNIGGVLAPSVHPLVAEYYGPQVGPQYAMDLASVICIVGAVLWWWVDPAKRCRDEEDSPSTKPLVPPEQDPR
jgi:MFS family permease